MYVGLYRGEASNIICVNNVMLFVKYIIIIVCRLAGLDLLLLIMFAYNTVYIYNIYIYRYITFIPLCHTGLITGGII